LGEIIRGAVPFCLIILFMAFAVILFPQIALWLPGTMSR